MLIDSDVIIWYLRGNRRAMEFLDKVEEISISAATYMEVVQGLRDKTELRGFKQMIREWQIEIVLIDEEITMKAMGYIDQLYLSHSLSMGDALIGATAFSIGQTLATANDKHYKMIKELDIQVFRP